MIKIISPHQYDPRPIETTETKKPPPGPEWKHKRVAETDKIHRCHWISPTRNIQFRRWGAACEFETLRQEFGNEVRAWEEYRRMKKGSDTYVISRNKYDSDSTSPQAIPSTKKRPPGLGWKYKFVVEVGVVRDNVIGYHPLERLSFGGGRLLASLRSFGKKLAMKSKLGKSIGRSKGLRNVCHFCKPI